MTSSTLFIPSKIYVGQQYRNDTYSGRLGFVAAINEDGTRRKETSVEHWRDKSIDLLELTNEPKEGWVLNRHGGGGSSHGWNARQPFIRCWSPDAYEIEITPQNLLYILRLRGCQPGKGLEGKFLLAWDRDKLVLLPDNSEEFKESKKFSSLQGRKVSVKELIEGATYLTKRNEKLVYLGKHLFHNDTKYERPSYRNVWRPPYKKFLFHDGSTIVSATGISSLGMCINAEKPENFAYLVEEFTQSYYGSKIVGFTTKPIEESKYGYWCVQESENVWNTWITRPVYNYVTNKYEVIDDSWIERHKKYWLEGEAPHGQYANGHATSDGRCDRWKPNPYSWYSPQRECGSYRDQTNCLPYIKPTGQSLYWKMESGAEIEVN